MTQEQIERTQGALKDVQATLTRDEARLSALRTDLGNALAGARLNERGAEKRAGTLAMDAAKLEGTVASLRAEKQSLHLRIETLEREEAAQRRVASLPAFQEINQEVRELERQFAEIMRSAATVGQRLRDIKQPWFEAKRSAELAGNVINEDPPRRPTGLVQPSLIDDPEHRLGIWLAPSHERFIRERGPEVAAERKQGPDPGSDRVISRISGGLPDPIYIDRIA